MEIWTSEKSGSKSVFREVGIGDISGERKKLELLFGGVAVRSIKKALTLVQCPSLGDF